MFSRVWPSAAIVALSFLMLFVPSSVLGSKSHNTNENVRKLVFKLSNVPVNVPLFNSLARPATEYLNMLLAESVSSKASVMVLKLSFAGSNPSLAIFLTSSFVFPYFVAKISQAGIPYLTMVFKSMVYIFVC